MKSLCSSCSMWIAVAETGRVSAPERSMYVIYIRGGALVLIETVGARRDKAAMPQPLVTGSPEGAMLSRLAVLNTKYFPILSFYTQLFISRIVPFSLSGCFASHFSERYPIAGHLRPKWWAFINDQIWSSFIIWLPENRPRWTGQTVARTVYIALGQNNAKLVETSIVLYIKISKVSYINISRLLSFNCFISIAEIGATHSVKQSIFWLTV